MNEQTDLRHRQCRNDAARLDSEAANLLAREIDAGWSLNADATEMQRSFRFKNYYHTIAFVNALAWIANQQDHHPDLEVGYNRCLVRFSTHSVGGLSENDFICAARVDALSPGSD
ncbi:MAG: 4a-hydroxytetrahydrobiopterin dehydratase [Thiogranum sp.]|nr:4a-hydroxytetrahydrobiopterin dehydratase [Thiogranum sp.]